MGHAVFVFGAAGAGKTTFCRNIRERAKPSDNIRLINLDPAYNDASDYDVDLCQYITVQEVMANYDYGPNGALFHALEEMVDHLDEMKFEDFEEEYFIFDCPGQIELFLHSEILHECIKHVSGFAKIAVVYLTDAVNFVTGNKYLYASLFATLAMSRLYCPFINVLSKVDLIDEETLESILAQEHTKIPEGDSEYDRLTRAIIEYIENYSLQDFLPLNWDDEDTVQNVLYQLNHVLQREDDLEVNEKNKE